jgi:hypothetical protein
MNASGTPAAASAQNAGVCGLSPKRTTTATTVAIVTNVAARTQVRSRTWEKAMNNPAFVSKHWLRAVDIDL